MFWIVLKHWKFAILVLVLIAGPVAFKIWLNQHDARILDGYVLLAEKTALEARLTELERQKKASDQAATNFARWLEVAKTSEAQAAAELEQGIASYEKRLADTKRSCLATDDDIDFIVRHR